MTERYTEFTTPGSLDIRAITTFGMSAKPCTRSPIGQFGTGLKYAIAVILRHGGQVEMNIDGVEYVLYTKSDSFRGAEFSHVRMKRRSGLLSKWQYESLPFTTELGKHWKLWQAFRELQSNTLDENGSTSVHSSTQTPSPLVSGQTVIRVIGEGFAEIAEGEESVFLQESRAVLYEGERDLQILEGESQHLYYRGIRVCDLEKPSRHTYNFLTDMTLTEDRTLASQWTAAYCVVSQLSRYDCPEGVIRTAVAARDSWESTIDWDYASERVKRVARDMHYEGDDVIPKLQPPAHYYNQVSRSTVTLSDVRDEIDEIRESIRKQSVLSEDELDTLRNSLESLSDKIGEALD